MEDERIIDLYWDRNQTAIDETAVKYGSFLHRLSWNILRSHDSFVSDEEVGNIVDFLKNQNLGNVYSEDIEDKIKNIGSSAGTSSSGGGGDSKDSYFVDAGKFIIDKDKASIGMLQRVLK